VKITPDGKVKVLDFGLAKVREAPSAVGLADSPTLLSGSMPGVIMGTAGYMSPEQARGRNADHRSDVFSFGCMFYEMLTGRPTFQGEEVSDVLASVLKSEPDMNLLPANLNPRLPELLRRCLAKNRKDRWHAVGDLRVEIERLLSDPFGMVSVPQTAPKPRLFPMVAIPLLTAIVVGIAVGVTVWNLKPPVHGLVARLSVVLPADQDPSGSVLAFIATKGFGGPISFLPLNGASNVRQMAEGNGRHLAFSRDGRWVAYEERAGERSQIFVRPYPGLNTKYQITEDGNFPVWSPDSKQLFYISAPNKFFVVDIQTEPSFAFGKPLELPIAGTLHDRNGPRNYDITPDGKQFVVVMPVSQTETNQPSAQINVVLNWLDELKQRVPVK
jgi:serine/threonine protein kinase